MPANIFDISSRVNAAFKINEEHMSQFFGERMKYVSQTSKSLLQKAVMGALPIALTFAVMEP